MPSQGFAAPVASAKMVSPTLTPWLRYTLTVPSLAPATMSILPSPFTSAKVGADLPSGPTVKPLNGFAAPIASVQTLGLAPSFRKVRNAPVQF